MLWSTLIFIWGLLFSCQPMIQSLYNRLWKRPWADCIKIESLVDKRLWKKIAVDRRTGQDWRRDTVVPGEPGVAFDIPLTLNHWGTNRTSTITVSVLPCPSMSPTGWNLPERLFLLSTHNHYHPAHRTRDKDNELDDSGCVLTRAKHRELVPAVH